MPFVKVDERSEMRKAIEFGITLLFVGGRQINIIL